MFRRALVSVGLLCLFVVAGRAQQAPTIELFGGYCFLHANPAHTMSFASDGWDLALVANAKSWLGIEANLSDHYGTSAQDIAGFVPNPSTAPIPYSTGFAFLIGPHFSYHSSSKFAPFLHLLFGGVRGSGTNDLSNLVCNPAVVACSVSRSQTAFGALIGGGLDWRARRSVSIRIIQADYQRAQFTGNPQNNLMISAGVVLTFGRR